jgi:hypothetical protein
VKHLAGIEEPTPVPEETKKSAQAGGKS